jgi:hypothetical protein
MTFRIASLLLLAAGCGGDQKLGVYNAAPIVSISSPPDGTSVNEGDLVNFQGLVSDAQTPAQALLISWSSEIAGVLTSTDPADSTGLALYSTASLTDGNHAITLSATDEAGERAEYTISLTVTDVPDAPSINIVHPASGEAGQEGESFNFVVQVTDQQDEPSAITLGFESDVDGVFCTPTPDSIGVAECDQALSAGDHRLTFVATDTDGLVAREEYYFTVVSARAVDDDDDGWNEDQGDCDDGDGSVNPGADEYYNDRDDDCDGVIDDGTVGADDDGDGQSELGGDCDDESPETYEGAEESCDGQDNDCDSIVDETTNCYDDDGDGFAETGGDCDDASAVTYTGAPELEDTRDNDCDGTVDEGTRSYDDDLDGYTESGGDCDDTSAAISPLATEACNGVDDDCDGSADERDAAGCYTYYYDYDGDTYGSTAVAGQCLCSYSGYYTAANATDCYDYNASANPVATSYSSSSRGDGSFDFNCDSVQDKYYDDTGDCYWVSFSCGRTPGWSSTNPSCGSGASYVSSCREDTVLGVIVSCGNNTSTYTQSCR